MPRSDSESLKNADFSCYSRGALLLLADQNCLLRNIGNWI